MRFGEFWKLHGRNTGRAPIPKASSSGRSASRLLAGSSMNCTYLLWPWPTPAFRPYRLPAPDSGGCSRAQQERRLGGPPGPLGADTRIKARTVPALWLSPRQERARSREQKKTITAQAAWERTDAQAAAPAGPRSAHAQKAGARGRTPSLPPPCPAAGPTSTATLKSTMETLVLRCQHTCTMVLPRCGAWRSNEVREALRSSSDSWSPAASSGDSAGAARGGAFLSARQEGPCPAPSQGPNGMGRLGVPGTHRAGSHTGSEGLARGVSPVPPPGSPQQSSPRPSPPRG